MPFILQSDGTRGAPPYLNMAWIALGGLVVNAIWGFSWADPLAALAVTPLIVREGWQALTCPV